MFDDIQVIEQVIEGTYKKLKSYYYYDKTLLHIKNKIVDFETGNSFADRMKKLCKNLYEENQEYFEELINDIENNAEVWAYDMQNLLGSRLSEELLWQLMYAF